LQHLLWHLQTELQFPVSHSIIYVAKQADTDPCKALIVCLWNAFSQLPRLSSPYTCCLQSQTHAARTGWSKAHPGWLQSLNKEAFFVTAEGVCSSSWTNGVCTTWVCTGHHFADMMTLGSKHAKKQVGSCWTYHAQVNSSTVDEMQPVGTQLTVNPNIFSASMPTRGAAQAAMAPSKHLSKA